MDNVKLLEVLRLYAKSGIFSLCLMLGLVAYGQDPVPQSTRQEKFRRANQNVPKWATDGPKR